MGTYIVSDSGPLISLEKLTDGFGFIRKLYEKIIIPPAVYQEVSTGANPPDLYDTLSGFIEVSSPAPTQHLSTRTLHQGEAEAILLAQQRGLPLLIEEAAGRRVARELKIPYSGIAGQIVKARRLDRISRRQALTKVDELFHAGRVNQRVRAAVTQKIMSL